MSWSPEESDWDSHSTPYRITESGSIVYLDDEGELHEEDPREDSRQQASPAAGSTASENELTPATSTVD